MDHCDFGRSWAPIAHRFLLGRFRYSDVSHRNIDKVLLPNLIKRSFFECDILVLRTRIENEVVQHLDPFCRRQNTELDEKLEKKIEAKTDRRYNTGTRRGLKHHLSCIT